MAENCTINSPISPMDLSPTTMDCSPSLNNNDLETVDTLVTERTEETTVVTETVDIRKKNRITKKKVSKLTKKKYHRKKSFRKLNTKKATAKKPRKKVVNPTPEPVAPEDLSSENTYIPIQRRFRAWKCDDYIIKVLEKRGWKFVGEPSDLGRDDYPKSMKKERLEGKLDMEDCLFWADDDDARVLQGLANNHLISCLPSSDLALTKIFQQTMFNSYDWFPTCWTLPEQKEELCKFADANEETYYICKPKNSYGGFGMCVYKANSEEFKKGLLDRKCPFVVQKYMHNPYLFAGIYKFHLRCYMTVTNARKPLKAYLYKDAQIQFCTHKFDLNQIESNFNKYSHITNYKVNNEKKNAVYLLNDKPGIGKGSEWPIKKFFKYMSEHDSKWDTPKFWKDLTEISTVVAEKIAFSPMVSKSFNQKGAMVTNHFEIYGLDIIMDENRGLWLTEANTQPGLDFTEPIMADGAYNKTITEANDITKGIINDTMNLLGVDDLKTPQFAEFIPLKTTEPKEV